MTSYFEGRTKTGISGWSGETIFLLKSSIVFVNRKMRVGISCGKKKTQKIATFYVDAPFIKLRQRFFVLKINNPDLLSSKNLYELHVY